MVILKNYWKQHDIVADFLFEALFLVLNAAKRVKILFVPSGEIRDVDKLMVNTSRGWKGPPSRLL